jgi:glycerol kinase
LLGMSLPIAGLAGDQQSALFGQGCCREGLAKNTYGTGAFLLVYTGTEPPTPGQGILATAACGPAGEPAYALEGSVFIAGAAVQWLRDGLGIIGSAGETEALARSVPDAGGVHFVPAFVGLGTPHWEAEARGTITGLTRGTTRAHLVRAALEAMAFSSAELLQAMTATAGVEVPVLRVDGGASANDWLMQMQADVLGLPVERPDMVETTALGVAGLAGLAVGVWRSGAEFLGGRRFQRFEPRTTAAERSRLAAGWGRAVDATLAWARAGS